MNYYKQLQEQIKSIQEYEKLIHELKPLAETTFYQMLNNICMEYTMQCRIKNIDITYKDSYNFIKDNPYFTAKNHNHKRTPTIFTDKYYCFTLTGTLTKEEIKSIETYTCTILKDTIHYNNHYDYYFISSIKNIVL